MKVLVGLERGTSMYELPRFVAVVVSGGLTFATLTVLSRVITPANQLTAAWCHVGAAAVTFVATLFTTAPYGRFADTTKMSVGLNVQLGWFLQEVPTLFALALNSGRNFGDGSPSLSAVKEIVSAHPSTLLFAVHYVHRSLVYPLYNAPSGKQASLMPLHVCILANLYCSFNGHLQTSMEGSSTGNSNTIIQILGAAMFLFGMLGNIWHDRHIIALKREHRGYVIPHGGLYRFVCSPNYLCELVEWTGFALCSFGTTNMVLCGPTMGACSFVLYTASNLVTRALSNHKWYNSKFGDDYRKLNRKAIIPFLL